MIKGEEMTDETRVIHKRDFCRARAKDGRKCALYLKHWGDHKTKHLKSSFTDAECADDFEVVLPKQKKGKATQDQLASLLSGVGIQTAQIEGVTDMLLTEFDISWKKNDT